MKKKPASGDLKNYITSSQARGMAGSKADFSNLTKYSLRGSRKTYYHIDDIKSLSEEKLSTVDYFASDKIPLENTLEVVAYVDGSFNAETGTYGAAAILTMNGEVITSATSTGTKMSQMRNVGGEISAAMLAVKLAEQVMADSLIVRYDYEGIEKWPTGEWGAKNDYTKAYRDFMLRKRSFTISYEHVKAHSGDKFNEMADDMAIKACGVTTVAEKTPGFNGERNSLTEKIRLVKHQVCASCLKGIEDFYKKDKHAFKDYAALKCHYTDNLSRISNSCEFETDLTHDEMMYVSSCLMEKNDILNALRWTVRGLKVEDAVRKALVDKELFGKKR